MVFYVYERPNTKDNTHHERGKITTVEYTFNITETTTFVGKEEFISNESKKVVD